MNNFNSEFVPSFICLISCIILCSIIPNIGFGVASFVIENEDWDNGCSSDKSIIPLWLIVNGTISIIFPIIQIIIIMLLLITIVAENVVMAKRLFIMYSIVYMLYTILMSTWIIIGIGGLYKNTSICQFKGAISFVFYIFISIMLCIQYLLMFPNILISRYMNTLEI